jgi:hypothetical protein
VLGKLSPFRLPLILSIPACLFSVIVKSENTSIFGEPGTNGLAPFECVPNIKVLLSPFVLVLNPSVNSTVDLAVRLPGRYLCDVGELHALADI